jgi:hypothetical protein
MIRSYIEEVPPPATTPKRAVAAALVAAACACTRVVDVVDRPAIPRDPSRLTLAGQFSFPALGRFPAVIGLPFGGISGLAAMAAGTEIFGISDDNQGSRVYRFRLAGEDTSFRVERVGLIPLEAVLELPETDPESIVVLPSGNLLIASEGRGNIDPRVPPSLVEFDRYGKFIRRLPLPGRYEPNPTGPLVKGVRSNTGLESLTLAPGGRRLYTAVEAALAQDGEPATFERGSPARILEYVRRNDSYGPAREFVYIVEPIDKPPFETRFPINGLVELVALGSDELLAMERSFVLEAGGPGRSFNRIRVFRIGLAGATDVSSLDSLRDSPGYTPVTKRLVLDLSDLNGLDPDLAPSLDNFEGLAFGPILRDGRPTLVVVSDDNFNPTQRTWFLQLAIGTEVPAQRIE